MKGKTIRHNQDGSRRITYRRKGVFGTTHVRSYKDKGGCLPGCLIAIVKIPYMLALLLVGGDLPKSKH